MLLEITPQECHDLLQLLDQRISELGPEVRRTHNLNYRQGLKGIRHELWDLRERLQQLTEPHGLAAAAIPH
jgi:hypothetical protein